MKALVLRGQSANAGTPGVLTTEAGFTCDTLELPWRDNQRGLSCIIPDIYIATPWYSPTLGRMVLRLEDKHGRKDCLIHNGNFAGDTTIDVDQDGKPDLITQVHGCTEVGRGYGNVARPDGVRQYGILNSKVTLEELVTHMGPGPHIIEYRWGPDCSPT